MGKDGVHPDHPEHAGTQHHDDGGHHRLAQPAGGGDGAVHKGRDAVGKGHHSHPLHAGVDNGGFGGEQRKEGRPAEEQRRTQHKPHAEGVAQTDEVALLHPVRPSRAVVLAHKAGAGHVEGRHAVVDQPIRVGGGAVALDHQRVKGVDARLNEQVGDGKNGVLQPGGHTQRKDALGLHRVQLQFVRVQRVAVLHPGQRPQDQKCGNTLADGTGQRHAYHAQIAHDNKEQVQRNVQRTGNRKVEQRLFGVADGAEHRVAEVVQRQRRHTQKIHPQIQDRAGQQIFLGVQQPQHGGGAQQTDEQQHHTGNGADDGRRVDGLFHVLGMARTIKTRHQHVDAVAQTNEKAGEQGHQRAGGAHSAQRRGTGKAPHHRHVRHIEQHLQQVGKRQRQTDQKDLLGQRAFRQRIRLRTHTFFLYPIHPNRTRAHRGTASIIRHCAAFARWIR